MIELLKSGLIDNSLLCELAVHPDFPRLMADLEIYVNGIAGKQVQSANAIVDGEYGDDDDHLFNGILTQMAKDTEVIVVDSASSTAITSVSVSVQRF